MLALRAFRGLADGRGPEGPDLRLRLHLRAGLAAGAGSSFHLKETSFPAFSSITCYSNSTVLSSKDDRAPLYSAPLNGAPLNGAPLRQLLIELPIAKTLAFLKADF